MSCRARYCVAETQFDPKVAERDLRRYQRHGPDTSTQMLLAALDVGSGIGVIGMELAGAGLTAVTLADASPAFLEAARRQVEPLYASRPTQFILGAFAAIASTLPDADVVTLDRVVCCHPDVDALLQGASMPARRIVAFTYHPDRWYLHAAVALENFRIG